MKFASLAEMFFSKKETLPQQPAYQYKTGGEWQTITYAQAVDKVEQISAGLLEHNIKPGDPVAMICQNRWEWALTDYAALAVGAILVPIYPSLTPVQIRFILNDCAAKMVIVEDISQMEKIAAIENMLQTIVHFVVIDPPEELSGKWQSFGKLIDEGDTYLQNSDNCIAEARKKIQIDDVATIIYTSGTTGEPKGVVLNHKNFLSNIESVSQFFDCGPNDITLSFLPLSHIFERTAGHYFTCYHGATVAYAESIEKVADNILEIRPTLMVSVPRLYEKMYIRILDMVESGSALKRRLFWWAIRTGRKYRQQAEQRRPIRSGLRAKHKIANKLVFHKIQLRVGGRLRFFISGGAPLSAEIGEFFAAAGLNILEGYGLTETSPGITFNRPDAFRFGTVGIPIPGVEVKIASDGEICTRGDHVMQGYFNRPDQTHDVIDPEGWFYTGDIGFFDDDGYLTITDRKKNLIVTSGGKNVAPQPIENALLLSKFIEQVIVIGDKRHFCSAIIVPSRELLCNWAEEHALNTADYPKLLENSAVQDLFESEISRLTSDFARFEQIKKFILIPEPFTQESGALTPSLKIKRDFVEKQYSKEIERMYE